MHNIKNSSKPDHDEGAVTRLTLFHPNQLSKMSPWQLDFRQMERGNMNTHANIRPGDLVTLLEMKMSHGVHQVGASPKNTINFGIPYSHLPYKWRGSSIESRSVVCFGVGAEFDAYCAGAFNAFTLSVSEPGFELLSYDLGLPSAIINRLREPAVLVGHCNTSEMHRIGNSVLRYLQDHSLPFDIPEQEDLILHLVAAIQADGELIGNGSEKLRSKAFERALKLMLSHIHENLRVSVLCREVGVSWSTLDRAFKERFGFGPKSYLLRLRLDLVRESLCNSPREIPIADTANMFGFWHMGQFAKDYRAMFGELPRETSRA
ncbi:transcriptional regulator EutR [Roseibium album]|nr:transcriptional regulator EutR [Roseibium album]